MQVAIMLNEDRVGTRQRPGDTQRGGCTFDVPMLGVKVHLDGRAGDLHVGKLLEKIEMPQRAAKFTVRDGPETQVLLATHDLENGRILQVFELSCGERA